MNMADTAAAALSPAHATLDGALTFWRAFNLTARKDGLTAAAEEMATASAASLTSRKSLMEAVRDFRALSDDAARGAGAIKLVKTLTDEIDTLTKRAKAAEKAYAAVARELMTAADPVPHLERVQTAVSEQERLAAEVREYEQEVTKLRNQDITIRELEQRIEEFESAVEVQVAARMASQEAELRRVFDQELEGVREAETAAEARVAALTRAVAEAEAARDEAQAALYAQQSRAGGDGGLPGDAAATAAAEAEAVSMENLRLRGQIAALEEQLKQASSSSSMWLGESQSVQRTQQLDALRARAEAAERDAAAATAAAAARIEAETAQWTAMLEEQRAGHATAVADMQRLVDSLRSELAMLRQQTSASEVAALKSQLAALSEAASGGFGGDLVSGGTGDALGDTYAVVIRRLRTLEDRALKSEQEAAACQATLAATQSALTAAQQQHVAAATRVTELEDALATRLGVGDEPPSTPPRPTSAHNAAVAALLSPDVQLSAIFDGAPADVPVAVPSRTAGGGPDTEAMMNVLKSQRDRYRARAEEQAMQMQRLSLEAGELRTKHDALLADNVKLYEKVRYLQSFLNSGAATSTGDVEEGGSTGTRERRSARAAPQELSLREEEDFEKRYKKLYDASLDPFSDFSRREKARQYSRLSTTERITLNASQVFLSNRYTRQFVFFYVLLLHLLVAATLLHFTHTSHDTCTHTDAHVDVQARNAARFGGRPV